METLVKILGDRIRTIRKQRGLTQDELAANALLQASYVGDVERGKRNISLNTLEKILKALDISFAEFVLWDSLVEGNIEELDKASLLQLHQTFLKERNIKEIQLIHRITQDILTSLSKVE